jgi:hypothetical protein
VLGLALGFKRLFEEIQIGQVRRHARPGGNHVLVYQFFAEASLAIAS